MDLDQSNAEALVDGTFLLEKFPGKGGWTFAALPAEVGTGNGHFGWRVVRGSIDALAIEHYKLMPMGNGRMFLPVKATWRKALRKKAGDWVRVVLYADERPSSVPEEFLMCLADEPAALQRFQALPDSRKQAIVSDIYAVKSEDLRVERMARVIHQLAVNPHIYL